MILDRINDFASDQIDALASGSTTLLTVERFHAVDAFFGRVGALMAPIAALLFLLSGIVAGIKLDSFIAFASSLGLIVALFVAHWCGRALMPSCDGAVANSSAAISSFKVFRVLALFATVGFLGLILFTVYLVIKLSDLNPLLIPLGLALTCGFSVWFLLNPSLVGLREEPGTTPGNDALAFYVFALASFIRLHRILFGLGMLLGNLAIGFGLVKLLGPGEELPDLGAAGVAGTGGLILVFGAALAPVWLYLAYIFSYLGIDLLRSILRIGNPAPPGPAQ